MAHHESESGDLRYSGWEDRRHLPPRGSFVWIRFIGQPTKPLLVPACCRFEGYISIWYTHNCRIGDDSHSRGGFVLTRLYVPAYSHRHGLALTKGPEPRDAELPQRIGGDHDSTIVQAGIDAGMSGDRSVTTSALTLASPSPYLFVIAIFQLALSITR